MDEQLFIILLAFAFLLVVQTSVLLALRRGLLDMTKKLSVLSVARVEQKPKPKPVSRKELYIQYYNGNKDKLIADYPTLEDWLEANKDKLGEDKGGEPKQ